MMKEEEETVRVSKLRLTSPVDNSAIHWNLEADFEEGGEDEFEWRSL